MIGSGERAERHWKRKRDPRWEKQLFGGRVCFNAGLSRAAVLVHCCWQHWSLERRLALSYPALQKPRLASCAQLNVQLAALVVPTVKLSRSHFSIGEQQTGSAAAPGAACSRSSLASQPSPYSVCRDAPASPASISVIAQQHLFALLCTRLCFTEGEVCLHFASVFELWQGQKYGRWVGMRESGAWWICFSYLV